MFPSGSNANADYGFAPPPVGPLALNRRPYDRHRPVVSTNVDFEQRPGSHLMAQTPQSAVSLTSSLSGPFVGYSSASSTASPEAISSHASPLGINSANIPYDPSNWSAGAGHRPVGALSRLVSRGRGGNEDGSQLSPPPPYSPQQPASRHDGSTPVERTGPPLGMIAQGNEVPTSTPQVASAAGPRDHRLQPGQGTNEASQRFPPPPAPSDRRARSSSRTRTNERPQPLFSLSALTSKVRSSSQLPGSHRADRVDATRGEGTALRDVRTGDAHRAFTMYAGSLENSSSAAGQAIEAAERPPASRRAASTGGIGAQRAAPWRRPEQRERTQAAWEPGMPLPPPPPGPPPPTVRSQSLNRSLGASSESSPVAQRVPGLSARRQPPMRTSLSPVPPTPANWMDQDDTQNRSPPALRPHRGSPDPSDLTHQNFAGGIEDHPHNSNYERSVGVEAVDSGAVAHTRRPRGIRERRNESRTGRRRLSRDLDASTEYSNNPWANETSQEDPVVPANLILSSDSNLLTRRMANPHSLDGRQESASSLSKSAAASSSTRNIGRPGSAGQSQSSSSAVPNSPFWPEPGTGDTSPALPPKCSATPHGSSLSSMDDRSSIGVRPISHLLHTPNTDSSIPPPLTPHRANRASSTEDHIVEEFARAAIKRHQAFAQEEAAAIDDRERVQIFAEYIVKESRIRRNRYAQAIDAMGSEILELTRDLFRPDPELNTPKSGALESGGPRHPGSLSPAMPEGFIPIESSSKPRPETAWWSGYMPSLSPIPSMSVTEVPDERRSRGRPSSRWWESSQTNSVYGGGTRGLERSKRESKYMGLPLREWDDAPSTGNSTAGPSSQMIDYPPEKVGWHEQITPRTSDPRKLDVSRLVTLPPPYPRHYPAVNNNHPDLAALRTVVRGLSELQEVADLKQGFETRRGEKQAEAEVERRRRLEEVRQRVEKGQMSYSGAAKIEDTERRRAREEVKADLEEFEEEILKPLHGMLVERISQATASYAELKTHLVDHNPIEDGDDKPELLEKLTLLKWLFEAEEQLHREIHELIDQRDELYKQVVMARYTDEDKRSDVETFFEKDKMKNRVKFEKESQSRSESFMNLVEETVTKGVEVQLSTFWDIAPPLVEVMQRVDVEKGVQADGEYEYSQQYLWEVLGHAEKSTYQFIEGQINLLCLLHEAKSGMTKQACKVMEAERLMAGEDCEDMTDIIKDEEERLTVDLKEKVRTVEKQWDESMGQMVEPLKLSIREWLQERGGWEGCEDD
ncbi:MAG: hypothetical protein M1816_002818 [Peltula sp. TS41687]|nr:MAG: hypothetical protein M1816_002818 [Peltula sp. TS41687]